MHLYMYMHIYWYLHVCYFNHQLNSQSKNTISKNPLKSYRISLKISDANISTCKQWYCARLFHLLCWHSQHMHRHNMVNIPAEQLQFITPYIHTHTHKWWFHISYTYDTIKGISIDLYSLVHMSMTDERIL